MQFFIFVYCLLQKAYFYYKFTYEQLLDNN